MPIGVAIETFAPLSREQTARLRSVRRVGAIVVGVVAVLWLITYVIAEARWRNGAIFGTWLYGFEHVLMLMAFLALGAGIAAHARLLTGDAVAGGARSERFLIFQQIIVVSVAAIIVAGAYVAFGTDWNRGLLYPNWQEPAMAMPMVDAEEHIARGLARKADGDFRGAVREFRAAVEVSPASPDAHWQLGLMYAEMGDGQAAIDQLGHVASIAPGTELAHQAGAEIERLSALLEPQ